MLGRLLPRQDSFFHFFEKTAELLNQASSAFYLAMKDEQQRQSSVDAIAEFEQQGDEITHATFETLHKTFITPFDRHDIHRLTSSLDDTLDAINRCAQRLPYYHLKKIPEPLLKLAEITTEATTLVKAVIIRLKSLKKSEDILKICQAIDVIEDQAHHCVIVGEEDLFLNENDFKEFYKVKDLYARTKLIINHCRDVTHIVKGIVLEYS